MTNDADADVDNDDNDNDHVFADVAAVAAAVVAVAAAARQGVGEKGSREVGGSYNDLDAAGASSIAVTVDAVASPLPLPLPLSSLRIVVASAAIAVVVVDACRCLVANVVPVSVFKIPVAEDECHHLVMSSELVSPLRLGDPYAAPMAVWQEEPSRAVSSKRSQWTKPSMPPSPRRPAIGPLHRVEWTSPSGARSPTKLGILPGAQ